MGTVIMPEDESVRLYEYEQFKPDLDEDTLEHFGILGMHWGQRNGPPYPLGSDKSTGRRLKKSAGGGDGSISRKKQKALKKARKTRAKNLKVKTLEKQKQEQQEKEKQQIEKTKEQIIKNKDIKTMYKNIDMFTNQDINDILTRLDTENRLKNKVAEMERASESTGSKLKRLAKESAKSGLERGTRSIISTVAENALKIGTKSLAKKVVAGDNEEYKRLIEQLFKEKKK